ncbi:hypothetical protein PSCICO_01330 [Pseudomonas cichorii]|uniref:hypothetical protein n=1 Tax=Pseudomonas cichorii TaxID=36746 RepID=UPI0019109B50|nr:hypothetical protein [Pseudomonas cichorii]GFM84734.1 hypothetical protein PSCICO_01330 [Pseudomonas cichorii]
MQLKIFNYELLFFENINPSVEKEKTSEPLWSVLKELKEAHEASEPVIDELTIHSTLLSWQNKIV